MMSFDEISVKPGDMWKLTRQSKILPFQRQYEMVLREEQEWNSLDIIIVSQNE